MPLPLHTANNEMPRTQLLKNEGAGAGHVSVVMVVACLFFSCSRPAFSIESTAASDDQPHLQLAPIYVSHSLGGNIGYYYERTTVGATRSVQQSLGVGVIGNIGVRSFFWQPWFAQVGANITGAAYNTKTSNDATPTYTTLDTSITGEAKLLLLGPSRFPFTARIFRRDDKTTSRYSGTNDGSLNTGYSLNQRYKSLSQNVIGNANFTSTNLSHNLLYDTSHLDNFSYDLRIRASRANAISISGTSEKLHQPETGTSRLLDTFMLNHSYQPNTIFSMSNVANLLKLNYDVAQSSIDANSLQLSSFVALRPEKSPLTMTSSVRIVKTDSNVNGILMPTLKSTNFNLGANFLFSRMIRMYGSVNVSDSLGVQTVTYNTALTGSKPYTLRTKEMIGGFKYSGSIGGSVSTVNTTSTDANGQTSTHDAINLGLYLSHALDKQTHMGSGLLSENLHQTVSGTVTNSSPDTTAAPAHISNLNTGGSLSWSKSEGRETSQYYLSATDSRTLAGPMQVFQMVNLQATRSEALNRNESLGGNLTVQATRAQALGSQNPVTIYPSAALNYQNRRLFNVLNLTYDSNLNIAIGNIAQSSSTWSQDQGMRSWNNIFEYKIGVLKMRLRMIFAMTGNTPRSMIQYSIGRPF